MADNGSGLSSLSGLYARDPAAAIRQRQLLRAQQMQQEGSSTAPVAHWSGGLNRIMQAVMGRLDENRLMGEQRAETEGRQEEASNFSRGLASHMTPQGAPQAQPAQSAQSAQPISRDTLPISREPLPASAGAVPAGYRLGGPAATGAADPSAPGYDPIAESERRTRAIGQPMNNPANAEWAAGLSPPVGRINAAWSPNQGQPPGADRIGAALLGQQPAPQPNVAPTPTPTAAPAQPGAGPTGMNAILAMAMKGQGSDNPMVREAAGRAMQTAALMGTREDRQMDNARADQRAAAQDRQQEVANGLARAHLAIAQRDPAESFGAPMAMTGADGQPVYVRPGSRGSMTPVNGYRPPAEQPFDGNGTDQQSLRILINPNSDPNSTTYEAAFLRLYGPRQQAQPDGTIITTLPPVPSSMRRPGSGGAPAPAPNAQPNSAAPSAAPGVQPASAGATPGAPLNTTPTPGGGSVTIQPGACFLALNQ